MKMDKTPRGSATEMCEIVLPQHANALGTIFGGQVMAWVDICAAIAAQRHCGRIAVTAAVDDLYFLSPIHVGQLVRLEGRVNAVFGSSLEVEVHVQVEDLTTRALRPCVAAYLTFVNLGPDNKPAPAPELVLETDEDRRRSHEAHERRRIRLERRR
jgi:acyl-CoA hydrolase